MPGMRLTLEGHTYDYTGKLMLPEAAAIQKATGMTYGEWQTALNKGDVVAVAALLWVLKKRAGEIMPFSQLDFDVNELATTFLREDGTAMDMEALAARAQALMAEDPECTREQALGQAMAEEMKPAPAEQEPANPTEGAGTSLQEPVPAPTPSTAPSPPTSPPSPTTSVSAPGSATA